MARTNKYTSVNYNHIYERNLTNNSANNPTKHSSSSSSTSGSYSSISSPNAYKNHFSSSSSSSRTHGHGRMLVLTRPASKPVSSISNTPLSSSPQIPSTQQSQSQSQLHISDQSRSEPESDQISLRPLGRTGAADCVASSVLLPEREKEVVVSPKPNKFVPPHLRPGFVGKEERPGPEFFRGKEANHRPPPPQQQHQGYFMSPGGYEEDGRPKSGGYDRMRRGGESDLGLMNRPRSSGSRPSSSG